MFYSLTKLTAVLGSAAVLSLGSISPAVAAPPPGERWSDHAGFNGPRTQPSRTRPSYATPRTTYGYPPAARYAPPASPAVASSVPVNPTASPAPATVAIRGPDGVVRSFPVEGPTVQQDAPAFVSVRGADGVVRAYPVASGPAAVPGQVVASPGRPVGPVVAQPCR